MELFNNFKIILASQSPRRKELLKGLGLDFEVQALNLEENYPKGLKREKIAIYLSALKARSFHLDESCENCLVITADTIVWKDDEVLSKPKDHADAVRILKTLSGAMHEVITGVSLRTNNKMTTFYSTTKVFFKELTMDEIEYYVQNFQPYDKAGAYGIQEWIGHIGIEKIEGSYFNVVGLPVQRLYVEMSRFCS
ncbi:MAG: septum formation protein Maf [Chlorobi bacterium]|nr:septum formation protein Maf [Chlorobiota bacterium]